MRQSNPSADTSVCFGLLMSAGGPIAQDDDTPYDEAETADNDLDRRAGIGWTTGAHTALPATVFAKGCGAQTFTGYYDNTDIPEKIIKIAEL